ncbi:MAG: phosphoribosyltransferase [Candidatus Methanomethylicus sp.]|nr:phosphoribosyltransferase [Candidatus Methanomethylicus sp.]
MTSIIHRDKLEAGREDDRGIAIFKDRQEAGRRLAEALVNFKGKDTIVLAIPRGGVVVAYEIAQVLGAPLDIIIPRKIGAPMNPELAIGAVSQDGTVVLNDDYIKYLSISHRFIESEVSEQIKEIERRMRLYRPQFKPLPILEGKVVIIVDDGIATGATIKAALKSIRSQKPQELVIAIPVGPEDTINLLKREADQVICLEIPHSFNAVGDFYEDFRQTEDEEVIELLKRSSSQKTS